MLADMKGTFAKQYALDQVSFGNQLSLCYNLFLQTPEGDAAVEIGLKNPHSYVMKPQREGGGTQK